MKILGIETSCDDTAIAVVDAAGGKRRPKFDVRANVISSQEDIHKKYGGVVPTLAAREHAKNIAPVFQRALKQAKAEPDDINLIAVTTHPGLMPSLVVGVHAARALAWALNKPILGINHLEGHVAANLLTPKTKLAYPAIGLVVSGGHTQLILMRDLLKTRIIGETRDDAAGEAFDKVARLLGLPFPGGPPIEKRAQKGNADAFPLPRPMINSGDFDFSFSGLKTAVLYLVKDIQKNKTAVSAEQRRTRRRTTQKSSPYSTLHLPSSTVADIAASFQQAVVDVLVTKTVRVAEKHRAKTVLLGGGVAANTPLRTQLSEALKELPLRPYYVVPKMQYALDNGAMIAAAAYLRWLNMSSAQRSRATWHRVRVRV